MKQIQPHRSLHAHDRGSVNRSCQYAVHPIDAGAVLLRPRDDFYASAQPGPADILLVIEFAESSIDGDRDIKTHIYAKARVLEYWLVDLNDEVVHVHTGPANAIYRSVITCGREQSIAPRALPSCAIATFDLLGE